jgi:hypothetical protein
MVLVCHVKPVLILPVPFMTLLLEASSEEKYLKMTPTGYFFDRLGKVLS